MEYLSKMIADLDVQQLISLKVSAIIIVQTLIHDEI